MLLMTLWGLLLADELSADSMAHSPGHRGRKDLMLWGLYFVLLP